MSYHQGSDKDGFIDLTIYLDPDIWVVLVLFWEVGILDEFCSPKTRDLEKNDAVTSNLNTKSIIPQPVSYFFT